MRISEETVRKMAAAYIKDNVLVKWRYDDSNETSFHARMCKKHQKQEPLTTEEISQVREIGNVVIEKDKHIEFFGFTGLVWKD